MNIVHLGLGIIPVPPGDVPAGREEYIYQLTRHFSLLGHDAHVIDIHASEDITRKRQAANVQYHTFRRPLLPYPYRKGFPFLRRFSKFLLYPFDVFQTWLFAILGGIQLKKLLSERDIDIIHTHQGEIAIVATIVNKMAGNPAKVLYTPQIPTTLPKWLRKVALWPERIAFKRIDHVVTLTNGFKKWLSGEYTVDPKNITVIHVGTAINDIQAFMQDHPKSRMEKSIPIVSTGGIIRRKNQLTSVKAFARIAADHPELSLKLVGPIDHRDYYDEIQECIIENGLENKVEIMGEVSKEELYNQYHSASIFLFPTTSEIQPTVMMEALAFGLPIVASNIEPNSDVVGSNEDIAILKDPFDIDGLADSLSRLATSLELRESMASKARDLADSMSYTAVSNQTIDLYKNLTTKKP